MFGKVWNQEKLHLQPQGENIFIVRKDDGTIHFMFSDRKIIRIDYLLSDSQYHYVMLIWPTETKIAPFVIPSQVETQAYKAPEKRQEKVKVKLVQKMLQEQKSELKQEVKEELNRTYLEIILEQEELNKCLMEGLVENLGQMLRASIAGSSGTLPSIEDRKSTAQISEVPEQEKQREKEKTKPRIKSDVLIKESEWKKTWYRSNEPGFTLEEIAMIPDMSTPKRNPTDEPHPNCVNIQTVRSPRSLRSSLSATEEGELPDYESEEDWDSEEGKRRRRVKPGPMVSNPVQSVQLNTHKRDEIKETRKIDVEALIEQKVSEKVDSFMKEKSKVNESSNSIVNLTDKIQVEVFEKYSGTNRVYKLTASSKFGLFDDYLKSELRTKKLEYVLSTNQPESVSETKLADDKHKVRDIIINHIDEKYYAKIIDLKEPREILVKLKEYKRLETRMTSVSARKDLYETRFNLKRERAPEFWDKFEEKVRIYENVPDADKISEKEKRDIFMHAMREVVPGIEVFNCLNRQTIGQDVSYSGLKDYLLQVESTTKQQIPVTAMYSRRGYRTDSGRCRGD